MSDLTQTIDAAAPVRGFKPYPTCKASGIEWLGEIPVHWNLRPLKRALQPARSDGSLIKGQMHDQPGEGLVQGFSASGQDIWVEEALYSGPGIVLSAVGARCGKTFKADGRWTAVANTHVIFPRAGNDRDFLWYLTNNEAFWDRGGTAQPFVRVASTLQRGWGFPSCDEQRAIAAFLDRETAKIDELVAKKEELIALVQEKRAALITRAVTKGLVSNVPMKGSGIEWLGDIPAHWAILPLTKYVVEKSDYRGKTPEKVPAGVFLVTARNVRMGAIDYECSQEFVAETDYESIMRRGLPKVGDILFTTEAPLGHVALVDREDIALAQRIIRFRISPRHFNCEFALFAMMSGYFQSQLASLSTGSTAAGLKASKLPMLRLIAPPPTEQATISKFLKRELTRIDDLVTRVRKAIERLRELRTAVISAAVSGKIDVTGETG